MTNEIRYENINMTKCNRRSNILHLSNQSPNVDDIEDAPCRFMANDEIKSAGESPHQHVSTVYQMPSKLIEIFLS